MLSSGQPGQCEHEEGNEIRLGECLDRGIVDDVFPTGEFESVSREVGPLEIGSVDDDVIEHRTAGQLLDVDFADDGTSEIEDDRIAPGSTTVTRSVQRGSVVLFLSSGFH